MTDFIRILFLLISCASWAQAHLPFQLRNGDRVVFYGDSITEPPLYTAFVETYAVTRFPMYRLEFRSLAWGGDRVSGGRGGPVDLRLQRDVIASQPTAFALMLGMNDGFGVPYDKNLYHRFTSGYEHIIDVLTHAIPDLRITVMRPSPFDEVTRSPAFGGGATTA